MAVVIMEADNVRKRFEATCRELGDGMARRVFSMALNKEGRKAYTAHRRALVRQTSIPRSSINAAVKFRQATRATFETRTTGHGRHLPLSLFGARQFSYGVRAKVWGKAQTYKSAFIVNRYAGNVFKRTSKARLPIERLWGPSIPVEMLKDKAFAAWEAQQNKVLSEAQRLIAVMLDGGGLRAGGRG